MTLDEAIKHAEEVAEEQEKSAEMWGGYPQSKYESHLANKAHNSCLKCAEEHRQLAEWLKELKAVRESWTQLTETIIEMRDNGGTGTQADVCKFLSNYLSVLEKEIMEKREV